MSGVLLGSLKMFLLILTFVVTLTWFSLKLNQLKWLLVSAITQNFKIISLKLCLSVRLAVSSLASNRTDWHEANMTTFWEKPIQLTWNLHIFSLLSVVDFAILIGLRGSCDQPPLLFSPVETSRIFFIFQIKLFGSHACFTCTESHSLDSLHVYLMKKCKRIAQTCLKCAVTIHSRPWERRGSIS